MKLIHQYPTKIENHKHEPIEKFFGHNQEILSPIYGLTPQDPQNPTCIYFNSGFMLESKNANNGQVFLFKTLTTFMIDNSNESPTADFLLPLVQIAFKEFTTLLSSKIKGTNLQHHEIKDIDINIHKKNLKDSISKWEKIIRKTSMN